MNSMASQPYVPTHAGMVLKRGFLAYIVILFFCNIAVYLSLAVSARLEPQYWIALLVVFAGVLAWFCPHVRWEVFRTPLFLWCVLFLVLTLIFFVAVPTSHVEQLKERIRDVVLLTTFLAVFLMMRDELYFIRRLVVVAVAVGVIINLIGFAHNGFLIPPSTVWAYRSGGFYINPNESAIALLLGMLLSFSVLPRHWRVPFVVFTLAGVAVTFSREAVLGWLVVLVCLCTFRMLRWRDFGLYVPILIVCAVVAVLVLVKADVVNVSTWDFYRYQVDRRFFGFLSGKLDASDGGRIRLLQAGWMLFLAHPLVGAGIGSTYHWSLHQSTHNMYLLYMDDYGIIGFFLYPLLMWCMIRKAAGETRKLVWTMAIFLLFWGLFDHNIVQNYYSLFAISLTAAMSRISATESTQVAVPISAEVASS